MKKSHIIKISNLIKVYGEKPKLALQLLKEGYTKDEILKSSNQVLALKNINLNIDKGSIFVIMGLSGSGKSTLVRHINRLIDPTIGSINIKNTNILSLSKNKLRDFRRHNISMVFQRFGLMPHLNVIDNISFGLSIKNFAKKDILSVAKSWVSEMDLEGYENKYPSELSGGQQQRVGLARALCSETDILLMDEPFSSLDPLIRYRMQTYLLELNRKLKKTIVFITHDFNEAFKIGNMMTIIKDGELIQTGCPKDIVDKPKNDYVASFIKRK